MRITNRASHDKTEITAKGPTAASLLQGEWEYLSIEKDGVVTEYKPEHRLTLSGDHWAVGDQLRHRVEVDCQNLVFHGSNVLPGTEPMADEATVAFGLFELKQDSLTYCMTPLPTHCEIPI